MGKRKKKSSSAKTPQQRTGVPLAAVRLYRMAKFTPQTMRNATKYYAKNLTALKSEADSTVVTWRLADSEMIGWEPFFDELQRDWARWAPKKDRWLDDREDAIFHVDHGFDVLGKARVMRISQMSYQNPKKPTWKCFKETYFIYEGDFIDAVSVSLREGEIQSLTRYVLAGNKTKAVYAMHSGLFSQETTTIKNDRYQRSEKRWSGRYKDSPESNFPTREVHRYHYRFDANGRVNRVETERRDENGTLICRHPVFIRPTGITKAKAIKQLEESLVKVISKTARRANVTEPLYALMICYCGEDLLCGYPCCDLVLAPASVRSQFLAEYQPNDERRLLYTWVGVHVLTRDETAEIHISEDNDFRKNSLVLTALCEEPNLQLDVESLMKPILGAARKLNRLDWCEGIPITDDFIVYAQDSTGDGDRDWKMDLTASVPRQKIRKLESRELLWPKVWEPRQTKRRRKRDSDRSATVQEAEEPNSLEAYLSQLGGKVSSKTKKAQVQHWIQVLERFASGDDPESEWSRRGLEHATHELAMLGEGAMIALLKFVRKWANRPEYDRDRPKRKINELPMQRTMIHALAAVRTTRWCKISEVESLVREIVRRSVKTNSNRKLWGHIPYCAAFCLAQLFDNYPEPIDDKNTNELLNRDEFTKRRRAKSPHSIND